MFLVVSKANTDYKHVLPELRKKCRGLLLHVCAMPKDYQITIINSLTFQYHTSIFKSIKPPRVERVGLTLVYTQGDFWRYLSWRWNLPHHQSFTKHAGMVL